MKGAREYEQVVNVNNISAAAREFSGAVPFDHCVVEDFFNSDVALALAQEFPDFEDPIWHEYNNPIEIKKVSNNWNSFGALTYRMLNVLNSADFVSFLSDTLQIDPLYADSGLNGGGLHIHRSGGKLNTHLDYSLHPKLGLQRKLNIIVYLNPNWQEEWGGRLGLWHGADNGTKPGEIAKTVSPKFNRAIIFDTTQNSWHGLPEPVLSPETEFRKSLAIYYMTTPPVDVDSRGKALYAPTKEQENDQEILDLIKKRADVKTASNVYK